MQSTADEAEAIHVELKNMMIAWQRNEPARKQQGSASACVNQYLLDPTGFVRKLGWLLFLKDVQIFDYYLL